jgi:hypothetical protein
VARRDEKMIVVMNDDVRVMDVGGGDVRIYELGELGEGGGRWI